MEKIFRKEEEEPDDVARITFNGDLAIDHPLAKEIRIYRDGHFMGSEEYSDVILENLKNMGFFIEDTTKDIPVFSVFNGSRIELD